MCTPPPLAAPPHGAATSQVRERGGSFHMAATADTQCPTLLPLHIQPCATLSPRLPSLPPGYSQGPVMVAHSHYALPPIPASLPGPPHPPPWLLSRPSSGGEAGASGARPALFHQHPMLLLPKTRVGAGRRGVQHRWPCCLTLSPPSPPSWQCSTIPVCLHHPPLPPRS